MDRTAAILAGGESTRLKNKALIQLAGKPMILHTIYRCTEVVDEVLVVVNSEEQYEGISRAIGETGKLRIAMDRKEGFLSPLLGARTAFENSKSRLTLLLPCDTPLVREEVLEMIFAMIEEHSAAIPRHPNGHIEPLHAVYKTDTSLEVVTDVLSSGKRSMRDLIVRLDTIYLSTNVFRRVDPDLNSFANVNTRDELRRAERKMAQGIL